MKSNRIIGAMSVKVLSICWIKVALRSKCYLFFIVQLKFSTPTSQAKKVDACSPYDNSRNFILRPSSESSILCFLSEGGGRTNRSWAARENSFSSLQLFIFMDLANISVLNDYHTKLLEINETEKPQVLCELSNYFIKLSGFCTVNPPNNQDRLRYPTLTLFRVLI